MYTKDGFHKALEQKLGDDAYLLLANGGHKKLTELLTAASLAADGNNTKLSITVGGTTKTSSVTVPYASNADKVDGIHANGLLTAASLGASGNSTTISVTVGGTTKTGSVTVPYATNSDTVDDIHASEFYNENYGSKWTRLRISNTETSWANKWIKVAVFNCQNPGTYAASKIHGYFYKHNGNWEFAQTYKIPFQIIVNFTGDTADFYYSVLGSTTNLRLIKLGTRNYEFQVKEGSHTEFDIFYQIVNPGNVTGYTEITAGTTTYVSEITPKQIESYGNYAYKSDTLDGYHADGLLTAASLGASGNSTTLSVTVGGTTKTSNVTVPYASNAGSVAWGNVTGKPSTYTPSSHNHAFIKGSDNRNVNNTPAWYMTNVGSASIYTEFCQSGGAVSSTYENRTTFTPWMDNSGQRPVQLAFNNNGMFMRTSSSDTAWNAWNTIIHSGNYTSYTVTKTGGGASGSWGISITGNAATATKWQTARTLTIGSKGKSVDGSANVSWSLAEIGAAAAGHTHRYINSSGFSDNGSTSLATWGTLTTANGYTGILNINDPSGGSWEIAYKSGQQFHQIDGYYYQNEGRYRVTDVTETVTALSTSGNYLTWTKNGSTNNITVPYASSAGSVAWGNVSGKPSTFTPSSHTHNYIKHVAKSENECIPEVVDSFQSFRCTTSTTGFGDGYIMSQRWSGGNYITQLFTEVDASYALLYRYRDSAGTWGAWKRIPMGDGTGASGTWGISITGNADTVDGHHQDHLLPYRYTYGAQTNSGSDWYVRIRTSDWISNDAIIYVRGEGSNTSADFAIHLLCRENRFWGWQTSYNGVRISGVAKETGSGEILYLKMPSSTTTISFKSTFPLTIDKADYSSKSYMTLGEGLFANYIYGRIQNADYADGAGSVAWGNVTSKPATATRWPTWDEVTGKPLSATSGNNGPTWGNFVPVKSDGVMEIGKYLDFHNSSNDGVDYAVRLQCQGNNKVVINLPTGAGTLARTADLTWGNVSSKPATATRWPTWAEVTSKPSSFTPATHTHGLTNSVFFVSMPSQNSNKTWKNSFGYNMNSNLLMSVRINSPAPEWCVGDYGSGILYGGADTKGFMSSSYGTPKVMWAGGNGTADDAVPKWYFGITGTSGTIYNLNSMPYASSAGSVAWGNVTGKPSSYTPSSGSGYYVQKLEWWTYEHSHDVNSLMSGTTFAYTSHNAPTNGTIVAFSCTNNGYPLQLQGQYSGENLYFRNYNGDNGTWKTWRTIIHSGNIGSQSVSYATSAGSATTASQVKDAGNNTAITFKYSTGGFTSNPSWLGAWNGYQLTYVSPSVLSVNYATSAGSADTVDGYHANRFAFTYCSANYGASSSVSVNDLVTNGVSNASHGMIYAATDNPVGSANWVHVWSQQWTIGTTSSWVSQIALGVQQGTGMWYRTYSGNIVGRGWTRVLDSSNYTSYCAKASHSHSYLPLSGGTLTGTLNMTCNTVEMNFRTGHDSYNSKMEYMTNGNEAMVWANKNAVTSFIFKCGLDLSNTSDWTGITPSLQIKNQSVYINSLITNGTTPSYNLYVNGTSCFTGNIFNNGNFYIDTGDTDKFIQFRYNSNNYAGASWRLISRGSGSSDTNYFDIETGGSNSSATTWYRVIRLTMDNRYVGIGTDSPGYKLDVNGNIHGSHFYMGGYLYMQFGGSWLSTIDNDGNGPIFGHALAYNNRRVYYVGSPVYICGGGYSNYASGITVTSSNNVGIGTTSPSYKLHVNGTSYLNGSTMINNSLQIGSGVLNNITNTSTNINALKIKPARFTSGNVNLSSFTTAVPGIICCNYTGGDITLTLPAGSATLEGSIVFVHITQHTNNNFYYKVNGQNCLDDKGNSTSQGHHDGGWSRLSCFFICIYDAYRGAYMWRFYKCTS